MGEQGSGVLIIGLRAISGLLPLAIVGGLSGAAVFMFGRGSWLSPRSSSLGSRLPWISRGGSDSQIEEVAVGGLITALLVALRGE